MSWLYYRVYDSKTMRLLAQGNAEECAAELGYRYRSYFQGAVYQVKNGVSDKSCGFEVNRQL